MTESTEHKSFGELFQESMYRHFTKHGAGPIPGSQAVSTDADIYVNRWDEDEERIKALTLKAGTFLLMVDPDTPGSMSALIDRHVGEAGSAVYLYSMAITEFPDDSELDTVTEVAEDGTEVKHIKGRTDGQPVQFKMSVEPVAPKDGRPISLLEAYLWAMVGDVEQEGDEEFTNAIAREALAMTMHEKSLNPWPPEPKKPDLPKQDTKKPTTHIQPISKVADKVTEVMSGEAVLLDVSGGNEAKRSVLTSLSLNYDGDELELSRPMTAYDKEIHNAVATLYVAGNRTFTARQVYQTMTGVNSNPSKKKIEEIEASLDKQRLTFVTLDWSKELRGKTAEIDGETVAADQCHLETYMLNAKKLTIRTAKGNEVVGYSIAEPPVLYQHAITTRQLISYPQALLEATSAVASNTNTNMLMRSYLIMRIKTMTRPRAKIAKQIRYDTVFEKAGAEPKERKDKARLVKTIKKYLDAFVKEGLIAGWSEYEAKGSSHEKVGVTVTTKRAR